jgi:hypothetical protein
LVEHKNVQLKHTIMTDYIHLPGTTPNAEPCAQVGDLDYMRKARIEAHVYINQLRRVYGGNPIGTRFSVRQCAHDFGIYLDIRFYFDEEDQRHVDYMDRVESGCDHWDEMARIELHQAGYDSPKVKSFIGR